jgi:hypothetical protein
MSIDEDQIRNISTGLPSAKGLSFYDKMAYSLGLQPTMVERQLFASNELYKDREKMKAATRAFGDALREAWDAGDSRAADVVIQRALGQGVDISSVMQSANTRGKQAEKTSAERMARPEALSRMQNVLGF